MDKIYELGKAINFNYDLGGIDEKLKFTLFPYKGSDIVNTAGIFCLGFITLSIILEFILGAEIYFTTFTFFGFVAATILFVYPTQIYYLNKIMEYKKEMLNTIMRFAMYLSMKANLEYALFNSLDYTKGILKEQFNNILLKLERKEYISLGEAFKDYTTIWNEYSPEFVDSLKLLEVASLSSQDEAKEIMDESIDQIILSYNIEQKRSSEELTQKITRVIMLGIMLPVMFMMLVPLVSVFMPDTIKASILFLGFNILIPTFLFVNGLNFSAKRLQLSNISIEESEDYKPIDKKTMIIAALVFIGFMIPATIFLMENDPSVVTFDSFGIGTIFYVWLIPAGISVSIYIVTATYYYNNRKLYERHRAVEEDLPHLLNYFATYLSLSVPMENIFKEIVNDYIRHGFKEHPSVGLLEKISFKLAHLKTNLKNFILVNLNQISAVKSFNEIIEQVTSFSDFSLKEAASVAKKVREQRINIVKLDDYILTLLNDTITLISSTMIMLAPMLGAMAIIMAMFVVTFIEFLTSQLEVVANLGGSGDAIQLELIDIEKIVSPVYLELIIAFYVVEILLILALIKSNIQNGYSTYNVIKTVKEAQIGFLIFSIILFGGYWIFKSMFADVLGIDL